MQVDNINTVAATVASRTMYAGATTSVGGWMLSTEGVAIIGIVLALGGFVTNWYFRRREDKRLVTQHANEEARRQALYEARMRYLQSADDDT